MFLNHYQFLEFQKANTLNIDLLGRKKDTRKNRQYKEKLMNRK